MIISNYILFVNYEKINFYIWFFQRKFSNDLETNTNGATLPTTNIKESPEVPIKENLNVSIEENLNEPVEENFDVSIEETLDIHIEKNSIPLSLSPNSIPDTNHN